MYRHTVIHAPTPQSTKRAMRRLQRDYVELQREGLSSIAAVPMESDFFEWHVNIQPTEGPYCGLYLHLILNFPKNYPVNPPKVKICTPIQHPNVFGGWLCLSMLRRETGNVPYEGWSSAYSATSVLMQLQSFLFAENVDQDGGYRIKAYTEDWAIKSGIKNCMRFRCSHRGCGHNHHAPFPVVKNQKCRIAAKLIDSQSRRVEISYGTECRYRNIYERLSKQTAPDYTVTYDEYMKNQKETKKEVQRHRESQHQRELELALNPRTLTLMEEEKEWDGAYSTFGCCIGRIFYEARISGPDNLGIRIGFGTSNAFKCGHDEESFGYDNRGRTAFNSKTKQFTTTFGGGDTITAAIDFGTKRVYFAKNGVLIKEQWKLPESMGGGQWLFPLVLFKDSTVTLNFYAPNKPCKWLIDHGFTSMQNLVSIHSLDDIHRRDTADVDDTFRGTVDWHSHRIIDELWLWIFECLTAPEVFQTQRVCTKWNDIITRYNIAERHEMGCYFSKRKLSDIGCTEILGIGLEIEPNKETGYGVTVRSQMDILSKTAWSNNCRTGVWGEGLTHFLPLVMNRKHSQRAHGDIIQFLSVISDHIREHTPISNPNPLEQELESNLTLKLVDSLIAMMNSIVVQFSMKTDKSNRRKLAKRNYYDAMRGSKSISMMMCEKVVIGYSALHHLLLFLKSKNPKLITSFADRWVQLFMDKIPYSGKFWCKDLGKLLIYTMISSQFKWEDIARHFLYESFTRNVKWMMAQEKYAKYNCTQYLRPRRQETFNATTTSRRLIMFQVWFSRSNAIETLHSYNQRLGRPRHAVRHGIVCKTKEIATCSSWSDYFHELRVEVGGQQDIDQLLRFAVWNSSRKRYHHSGAAMIQRVDRPNIKVIVQLESVKGSGSGSGTFVSSNALVIKRSNVRRVNVWNSSDRRSAANALFGRSTNQRVPRSISTPRKHPIKNVAAKMITQQTTKSKQDTPRQPIQNQKQSPKIHPIRTPLTLMTTTKVAAPKVSNTNTAINTDHRLSVPTKSPMKKVAAKTMTQPLTTRSINEQPHSTLRQPVYTKSVNAMKSMTPKVEAPKVSNTQSVIHSVQNTIPRPTTSEPPTSAVNSSFNRRVVTQSVKQIEPQLTQHKERVPEQRPFQLRATASEWNGYGYPQNNGLWISTPIQKPVPMSNTNSVPQHGWNGGSYQMMNTPSIWTVNATNPNTGMASSYSYGIRTNSCDIWNDMNITKDIDRFVVNDGSSISSRSALSAETPNEDFF